MKKTIYNVLLAIGLVITTLLFAYVLYDNNRLNSVIEEQNQLIKLTTGKDSKYLMDSKKYKDSIDKFTQRLTLITDGKKLNTFQILDAYHELESKNDSLSILLDIAKKEYGIKFKITKKGNTISYGTLGNTRADSASILYPYFKDKLKKRKGSWYIDHYSEREIKEFEESIDKKLKPLNDSLAKAIKQSQKAL